MIPKKIHYCWFGGNKLTPLAENCIKSWKKFFPDYEIIEWNESNFDVNYNAYTKEAYESKKWAFVSDVARLDIIYNYGGIYFDVDVEVIKNFDFLGTCDGYMGFESKSYVNTGLGFAAKPKNKIIKRMLDDYKNIHFIDEKGNMNLIACPVRNTETLIKLGLEPNGTMQKISKIIIFPQDYFASKDCLTGVIKLTDNSYSIHQFDGSWLPKEDKKSIAKRRKYASKYGEIKGIQKYNKIEKIKGLRRYIFLPFKVLLSPKKYINKLKAKKKNKKKKILFTNFSMCIGGVESVLINLLDNFNYSKYDVTLYLQYKEGPFLEKINKNVKTKGYNLSTLKFSPIRKIINGLKYLKIIAFNYHQYDFAACFSPPGNKYSATLVRWSSKNTAIWMHTNIINCVKNDTSLQKKYNKYTTAEEQAKAYLNDFRFRNFDKYIFVSQNALKAYLLLYKEDKNKCILCRNLIQYEDILEKAKEKPKENIIQDKPIFVNVSRHTEHDKCLSRIIRAAEKLKKDYIFLIIMVGDGNDHQKYIDMVKNKHLEKYFLFVGAKTNPYPYFKLADATLLTSNFEGFPTIFSEAMVLNIPIITTDVSDARTFIEGKYGIVVENNDYSIYDGMKQFLDEGFNIKDKFNPIESNKKSLMILEDLFDEKN